MSRRMLDGCAGMPRQAQMWRIERYFRAGCLKTSSAAAANGVVVVRTPWCKYSLCKQSDVSGMLVDVLDECDGNKQQLADVDGYVMDRGSHDAAARWGGGGMRLSLGLRHHLQRGFLFHGHDALCIWCFKIACCPTRQVTSRFNVRSMTPHSVSAAFQHASYQDCRAYGHMRKPS